MHIANIAAAAPAAPLALVDRKPLLAALSSLTGCIVERRNTIPIVSCVLIQADEAGMRLTATDLDMIATTTVPAAWEAPGAIAVDAFELLEAVKGAGGDTVQLQQVDAALLITGDGISSRVETRDPADFPHECVKPLDAAAAACVSLDAAQLAHDWNRVRIAQSSEETRYYLNGIFAHIPAVQDGATPQMTFAATDGHRLVVVERDAPAVTGAAFPDSILPRKLVAAVLKLLGKKASGDVRMAVEGCRVTIDLDGWHIRSKLIDGLFPDYTRVIPSANDLSVTFDGAQVDTLATAMAKASKSKGAVKVTIAADGGAVLEQTHEGARRAADAAAAWTAGEARPFVIGMNARYLADMAGLSGGGALVARFYDGSSPILWTVPDAPELVAVLMPMRVGDETSRNTSANGRKRKAAASPVAEPVESDGDRFAREYRAAYAAGDGKAMAAAVATWRASGERERLYGADAPAFMRSREHLQLAMTCARIRCLVILEREGAEGRHVAERKRLYRFAAVDAALCRTTGPRGAFSRIGERMRAAAAVAEAHAATLARLEALDGWRADDVRDVLPVVLVDGKRAFVRRAQLVDPATFPRVDLVKASGDYARRGRVYSIDRASLARICQPKSARAAQVEASAAAVPSADVAALVAQVETLAARVAELEARPAPAPVMVPVPVALYGPPAPAVAPCRRDRSEAERRAILRAWNMRRQLREARAEAAQVDGAYREALAAGRKALAEANGARMRLAMLRDRRGRTAARLVGARAAARTAQREARGLATGLAQAQGQLARLQPLADALAGLVAPAAAAPAGGSVVPLSAAR